MSRSGRVLLINPTITARRHARYPLAVMSLKAALEGQHETTIIDGNLDRDFAATAAQAVAGGDVAAVGVTVMGGPQLRSAIAVSRAIKAQNQSVPVIWGGAFPTVCPDSALQVPYVDYAVRGQGEETLRELLDASPSPSTQALAQIGGLSWRAATIVHNPERRFSAASLARRLPYESLGDPRQYLPRTYLGEHTTGYQAALGCRFRCTFCGVATMFRGKTALPSARRLEEDFTFLRERLGVDSLQFYDHNFFDREVDMVPLLEVLSRF
jgi:anaerobic magnesium-protoporphyrin IX monomethyl ester cyclase